MTDGHIDWHNSDGRPRTRKIILYSSKKVECEWFLKICHELFGIEGKLVEYIPNHSLCKKQPYKAFIRNAALAMVFILSGVPAGNKTKTPYLIPKWILNGDMKIKAQFLRFFFNFEGSVPNKKVDRPCSWQMSLHVCKSPELLGNCVVNFYKHIGFYSEEKTCALRECVYQ